MVLEHIDELVVRRDRTRARHTSESAAEAASRSTRTAGPAGSSAGTSQAARASDTAIRAAWLLDLTCPRLRDARPVRCNGRLVGSRAAADSLDIEARQFRRVLAFDDQHVVPLALLPDAEDQLLGRINLAVTVGQGVDPVRRHQPGSFPQCLTVKAIALLPAGTRRKWPRCRASACARFISTMKRAC